MIGSSPRRLRNAVRLDLLVQSRYLFPQIYLGLSVLYVLLFRYTLLSRWAADLLPVFLFSEPGLLGFYLAAAQLYFERGEGSLTAVVVTPLREEEYLLARAASMGLIATLAGGMIFGFVLGFDIRLALLLIPLFLTAALFTLAGVAVSAYFSEFTRFLMASFVLLIPVSLPVVSYFFGLGPDWLFIWIPSSPALVAFASLTGGADFSGAALNGYLRSTLQLAVYAGLAFLWARRSFRTRIRSRLDVS